MSNPTGTTVLVISLLQQFRNGDATARDRMIAVAQRRLEAMANRALQRFPQVRRFNDGSDIVQSATLRLWQALSSVKPTDARHFFALASQHIRWELLSLQEKIDQGGPPGGGHATQGVKGSDTNSSPMENEAITDDPISGWTTRKAVLDAIAKLPVELREVVDLYIMQELPRAEVASLLEISERQVNRLWVNARLKLAELLTD